MICLERPSSCLPRKHAIQARIQQDSASLHLHSTNTMATQHPHRAPHTHPRPPVDIGCNTVAVTVCASGVVLKRVGLIATCKHVDAGWLACWLWGLPGNSVAVLALVAPRQHVHTTITIPSITCCCRWCCCNAGQCLIRGVSRCCAPWSLASGE